MNKFLNKGGNTLHSSLQIVILSTYIVFKGGKLMNLRVPKGLIILLSIIFVSMASYYGYTKYIANPPSTTNNLYFTEIAKKSNIEVNVVSTGTVYASITKDVPANNSGELKDLSVKEGDIINKGQKLFTVDSPQIRQQVNTASINIEKQKLQLNKMKTQDDINLQNLQIKDAQNSYNNALTQLNDMTVVSPINGFVTARNNNNGDTVQSGKVILSIMDPTALKIKAQVDELDISKIKIGQKAQIKFNAIVDKIYEGVVESISTVGTTTNNVATYTVITNLNDKTGVMIGMTASISIQIESKPDALVIPAEALFDRGQNKFVMIPIDTANATGQASTLKEVGVTSTPTSNPSSVRNNAYQGFGQNTTRGISQGSGQNRASTQSGTSVPGKLVEVKIGIQNENVVEIREGITEGQRVMALLPQTSTASQTGGTNRNTGGFGGSIGGATGGFGGVGGAGRTISR